MFRVPLGEFCSSLEHGLRYVVFICRSFVNYSLLISSARGGKRNDKKKPTTDNDLILMKKSVIGSISGHPFYIPVISYNNTPKKTQTMPHAK